MKKRLLSLLLAATMVLTMLPGIAMAATSVSSDTNFRIVHLDCGRKYFSVANIEKLIDTMAQYGYNQLQLAFGNGGCRFLLDDMSLSFGDVTMASDTVKSNITVGNNAFNGDTRYLSQSDMDSIIAYAKTKGIDIVPMLNMPGHASAIVYNTQYSDSGNLNVANETAREYGYALLGKYVDYFKAQGCSYFHFGADESGYNGINMSTFLAGCAEVITNAGMTPRAFNDATAAAIMPTSVQITYWHKESGSSSASHLANAGYGMINTHGNWYYVIKGDQGTSEEGTKYWNGNLHGTNVSVELPVMKATSWGWRGINEFFDSSSSVIESSLGTMFCIWCDASQDTYLTDSDVISENENYGALYQLQKMAEHYWPEDISTDTGDGDGSTDTDTTTVTITTASGAAAPSALVTGGSALLTVGETATWTSSDENVISLTSADESAVALLSAEITATNVTATAVGAGTATITATTASGTTDTLDVTVADEQTTEPTAQTVNIMVGESMTFGTTGTAGNYITDKNRYIATATVSSTEETTASVTPVTTITPGKKYLIYNTRYQGVLTNTSSSAWGGGTTGLGLTKATPSVDNTNWWLINENGGSYYVQYQGDKYLTIASNTSSLTSTPTTISLSYNNNGYWTVSENSYYLNNLGESAQTGGWNGNGASTDNGSQWYLYEITEESSASSALTITGTGEGTTTVEIGGVTYTINVTAPETSEKKVLNYGGTLSLLTGAADVAVIGDVVSYADGTITAENADGSATVTFVTKNAGGYVTAKYTYNITVTKVDLSDVEQLSVELWVTNTPIGQDKNSNIKHWNGLSISTSGQTTTCTAATMKISADVAYGEDGVWLADYVLAEGVTFNNDGTCKEGYTYIFWKGVALHDGTKQYHSNSGNPTDQSNNGSNFLKIRYWNNTWQYYDVDYNYWVTKATDDNFVAYYLQRFVVSPELNTATRDWGGIAGQGGGNWEANWFDGFYGVGTAVVYPDHSMSPADEQAIYNNTLALYCTYAGSSKIQPGVLMISEPTDYRITKITIVQGDHADAYGNESSEKLWQDDDTVNWDKVPTEAGTEWYDETTIWTPEGYTGGTIFLDSTVWTTYSNACTLSGTGKNQAFLILIYIEPVEKEDNLNVIWWDDAASAKIMSTQIVVNAGTTYFDGLMNNGEPIGNKTDWSSNDSASADYLPDTAYVTNTSGVRRTFNKDITVVSELPAQYRTGIYKYIRAEISEDGKTLTLYYAIDNNKIKNWYVLDFGLPVDIPMSDIVDNADEITDVSWSKSAITSGTLVYDNESKMLTYTPTKVLSALNAVKFTISYTNGSPIEVYIGVMPASNVLYEEGFLTKGKGWENNGDAHTATSQSSVQDTLYGFDDAYVPNTRANYSNGTYLKATLSETSNKSDYLTVEFTGNTFDLIGECAPDTAMLYVSIWENGEAVKGAIVDTRFNDTKVNSGHLYQTPLVHIELDDEGNYEARIRAYYIAGDDGNYSVSTLGMFGSSAIYSLYDVIDDLDADGLDMYEAEYIYFSEDSPLTQLTNSYISTYAETGDDSTGETEETTLPLYNGTRSIIDGFRVYRSTDTDAYSESERGLNYWNVIDLDWDLSTEGTAGTMGYVEFSETDGEYAAADYEGKGGPQNEIYLRHSSSVVFSTGLNKGTTVQASVRAINGDAYLNGTKITSGTEMYYEIEVGEDGVIAIGNIGGDDSVVGMLAVANLKIPVLASASFGFFSMLTEDDYAVANTMLMAYAAGDDEAEEPEEDTTTTPTSKPSIIWPSYDYSQAGVFRPDSFEMDVTSYTLFGKRFVSIIVDASTDVEKLTINGTPVWASNYIWVKMGKEDEYRFAKLLVLDANEAAYFEVVAYNKNGKASKTYTITD